MISNKEGSVFMVEKRLMPSVIFREYDIRGLVDQELCIDQMYDLGCAIACFFLERNPEVVTVAVGMDGRTHSPVIKEALIKALQDSGLNVISIGLCHSPALYFALYQLPVEAGLMITASHNPKEYNGIKICLGTESIWGADIKEIYRLYKDRCKMRGAGVGSYREYAIIPDYVDWLVDHFAHLKGEHIRAVIDCGNGAGGTVIPQLIKKMHWNHVEVLYPEVDGTYPHHEADPVKLANMQDVAHLLKKTDATIGVGLDGDADRMAAMTKEGLLIPGDLLLGIFAQTIVKDDNNVGVVIDIKSSSILIDYLTMLGARVIISPSGHSIIKDEMRKHQALLGGELSCHFFFRDRYFGYDDGIYAMLRLFELIVHNDIEILLEVYPHMFSSPEFRIPCDEAKKKLVVQTVTDIFAQKDNAQLITIDGVRVTMPYGWGLLRASNTQPVLSLRFESQTEEGLSKIMDQFVKALAPFYEKEYLSKEFSKGDV
jgi:phosphomannomutase/phosphoglucomutase